MATSSDIQIDPEGTGPKVDTVEIAAGSPPIERQTVVLGDPDTRANMAKVKNSAPASSDMRAVVGLLAEAMATALFAKITDGTDVAAVDGSGNLMVALGAALDRFSRIGISDALADRFAEINAENSTMTNLLAAMVAKCRTSVGSLTNGNHGALTMTPAGSLWIGEKAAAGTPVRAQPTVDATTTNGVQLCTANATRRRVVVIQRGTVDVYIEFGNITAASTAGVLLAGTKGNQLTFYTTSELRATVASGSQVIDVYQEVL